MLLCMPLASHPHRLLHTLLALHLCRSLAPPLMLLASCAYCLFSILLASHSYRPTHTLPALHIVYFSCILPASHASALLLHAICFLFCLLLFCLLSTLPTLHASYLPSTPLTPYALYLLFTLLASNAYCFPDTLFAPHAARSPSTLSALHAYC